MNFNSLKDIVKWQKFNYDFNFHQQEFHTNMHVLMLSDTKSILPADCHLKLKPNVDRFDPVTYNSCISDLFNNKATKVMKNFRNYLSIISKLEYKISQSMHKVISLNLFLKIKYFFFKFKFNLFCNKRSLKKILLTSGRTFQIILEIVRMELIVIKINKLELMKYTY